MKKRKISSEQLPHQEQTQASERLRFTGNKPEYQTLLKNLSTQQKRRFQESILNSPNLLNLGDLKRKNPSQKEGRKK
jgi:hypothetical protein